MPLPNPNDVDDLLNSSDKEEDIIAANVAAASVLNAHVAGVIPPPPPEDTTPYVLLGQRSQTQDTLIPTQTTQLSDTAKRHLFLSQLSMTQGLMGGTEFDKLEQTLRQQYPTQTQEAHISKKQTTKEKKLQAKHKQSLPKALTKGRASGARGYTEDERINFLEILERCLPTSGSEWSLVANEHSETYPGLDRNVDSINNKGSYSSPVALVA